MHKRIIFSLSLLLLLSALAVADDVPAWLRQAAAASTPSYGKEVPADVAVLVRDF